MEAILVKVFATALALSQVTTRPDAVKTEFDPIQDRAEVMQTLNAGCLHMRKAFDIEDLNLDSLIETAMTDTQALGDEVKAFKGVKFKDLHIAYRQVCKNEKVEQPVVDAGQVIEFYNQVMVDLPDHTRLKGMKLRNLAQVLDGRGGRYAEIFEPQNRRVSVPLDVPKHVRAAFIAAEDKRFREHKGIDSGRDPCLPQHRRGAQQAARRLDHHPAGGEKPPGRRRSVLRTQDPRDHGGSAPRAG